MSTAAQNLVVKLSVGTDGLVSGLQVANKTVEGFASSVKTSFSGVSGATKQAEAAQTSLLGTIKEFRKEQTQQGRASRFLAGEIASIIPAAAGGSKALQGIIGAGLELAAGGGLLAVGFELAKVGVEHFTGLITEETERLSDLRKVGHETFNSIADRVRDATRGFSGWRTETQKVEQEIGGGVNAKVRALREQIEDIQKRTKQSFFGDVLGTDAGKIRDIQLKIQAIQAAAGGSKAQKSIAGLADAESIDIARRSAIEMSKLNASTASEATKIREARDARLKELDEQLWRFEHDGNDTAARSIENLRLSVVAESEERLRRLKVNSQIAFEREALGLTRDTMSAESGILVDYDLKIRELREKARQTDNEDERKHLQQLAQLYTTHAHRQVEIAEGAHQKFVAGTLKADEDAQRASLDRRIAYFQFHDQKAIEKMKEFSAVGANLGDALGNAFVAAATGAATFGQVVSDVAATAVRAVVQMAQTQLAAYALSAEGAAFFSQAGIPIIGPALGAAAIATTGAIFAGLIAALPKMADGGYLPAGGMAVVGERGPEVFRAGTSGSVIPNHALGGTTINIHAMDGASVQRVVESVAFRRALREATRNGVGP